MVRETPQTIVPTQIIKPSDFPILGQPKTNQTTLWSNGISTIKAAVDLPPPPRPKPVETREMRLKRLRSRMGRSTHGVIMEDDLVETDQEPTFTVTDGRIYVEHEGWTPDEGWTPNEHEGDAWLDYE
jgi:hypothetical protein